MSDSEGRILPEEHNAIEPVNVQAAIRALVEYSDAAPCARCGYDLRGRSSIESCPECNAPVFATSHPEAYALHDLAWISELADASRPSTALNWQLLVIVVSVIGVIGLASGFDPGVMSATATLGFVAIPLFILLRGVWLMTRPTPIRVLSPLEEMCRLLVRLLTIIIFPVCAVSLAIEPQAAWAPSRFLWFFIVSPLGLLGTVAGVAFSIFVRRIADMMGAKQVIKEAKINAVVLSLGFLCFWSGFVTPPGWGWIAAVGVLYQVSAGVLILIQPMTIARHLAAYRRAAEQVRRD
ncbi:MAG TPA: hypothetical protein P5081_02500 [Phycisphaerae bacterium]|nr:hypothetical protein [Phycisphaerae bacterium]HRW51727.1 hypothetical protein [Phycisphaerae bacterium]